MVYDTVCWPSLRFGKNLVWKEPTCTYTEMLQAMVKVSEAPTPSPTITWAIHTPQLFFTATLMTICNNHFNSCQTNILDTLAILIQMFLGMVYLSLPNMDPRKQPNITELKCLPSRYVHSITWTQAVLWSRYLGSGS